MITFKFQIESDLIIFLFCRGSSEEEFKNRERPEAVEERDVVQEEHEQPEPQEVRDILEHAAPEIKEKTNIETFQRPRQNYPHNRSVSDYLFQVEMQILQNDQSNQESQD